MANNIIHGAYPKTLAEAVDDIEKKLWDMGVEKPNKQDAFEILLKKSERGILSKEEIKEVLRRRRGIL